MTERQNTRILLDKRPVGLPNPDDFLLDTVPVSSPAKDEMLLKTIWLSLSPYMQWHSLKEIAHLLNDAVPGSLPHRYPVTN